MGHTTTTTTISVPLQVSYTCSKCGKQNTQVSYVTEWADSMRHGTIHRQTTYDKMSSESHDRTEYRIGRRLDQIVNEAKNNRYRKAELKCKCEHCGNTEPWAKMRFTRTEERLGYLMVMMIVFSLACFVKKDIVAGIAVAASLAVILTAWFTFKKLRYKHLEEQIDALPKKSLPRLILVIDKTGYVLTPENNQTEQVESVPSTHNAVESDNEKCAATKTIFCRKCGAKILSDSTFCDSCGEKIERV